MNKINTLHKIESGMQHIREPKFQNRVIMYKFLEVTIKNKRKITVNYKRKL